MSEQLFQPLADGTARVFALPPGADFASGLILGLRQRAVGRAPTLLARTRIFVNTERARRRLTDLLEDGAIALQPTIRPLQAVTELVPDLPPADPPVRRTLRLSQLVRQALRADPSIAAASAPYPLAESIAALSGEMQIEAVSPQRFRTLDPENAAGHWTRSLEFLSLIGEVMDDPKEPATDAESRLRHAVETLIRTWAEHPPAHPVIVAGSTGSRGATALLMAAVARLPQGAVILPGLDGDLPASVWGALAETGLDAPVDHPQWGLARICRTLGVTPSEVPAWAPDRTPHPSRNRLVSLALRPAPVTDQWRTDGPALASELASATQNLALIEAKDPVREAQTLALILRHTVETGQTAALITPDRQLARRVTNALHRWGLAPDDSAGRPLDLTPPGALLRLTAEALCNDVDPTRLLAVLKHPLTASTSRQGRGTHLGQTAALEACLRRDSTPQVSEHWLERQSSAPWEPEWASWLSAFLRTCATGREAGSLADQLARHRGVLERLAAGPGAPPGSAGALWQAEAGQAAAQAFEELEANADAGGDIPRSEYPLLLRSVLSTRDVPDAPFAAHPRISIWGTLEARTQTADLVLLAGLNEGIWPRLPPPDPWLSRGMRDALGLPLPEQRIGLSAHDFQQAVCAPRVVLSRALRQGEAPTVPTRWLLRLTNLLEGLPEEGPKALGRMRAAGAGWTALAATLERPNSALPRAKRPAPVVPPDAFPRTLPVTQIDRLIRDPYAVYAARVLRLRPLQALIPEADALMRGTLTHRVMERFIRATPGNLPDDAAAVLERVIRITLAEDVPWPALQQLWAQRLLALKDFIIRSEAERRALADPHGIEVAGEVALTGTPRPFLLSARADRLDRRGPQAAIYDYKGTLPSLSEARKFHKQLPLEAGIALRGGFGDPPVGDIVALHLIGLSGTGGTRDLTADRGSLDADWASLTALISAYQSGRAAMVARLRPKFAYADGDYDHLARRGEWQDSDPAELQVLE
ncbi:MAG: double-strand break repair protein AddB [Pseudomonadota bacterium]